MPRRPACPWCRSTLMTVIYAGPVVDALVDVADPDAGVRAVLVEGEAVMRPEWVWCASCDEAMGAAPGQHGRPAYLAAVDIGDEGPWPRAVDWQVRDVRTQHRATRLERIVHDADVARGAAFRWPTSTVDSFGDPYDKPGGGKTVDRSPAGQGIDQSGSAKPGPLGEAVDELRRAQGAADAARAQLVAAMRAERATGTSANTIARTVAGVMSRPVVLAALDGRADRDRSEPADRWATDR